MLNALFDIPQVNDRDREQVDPTVEAAPPKCAHSRPVNYVRLYYKAWYATKALGLPPPPRLPWPPGYVWKPPEVGTVMAPDNTKAEK